MARISGYSNDSELTGNDLLVGSSYEGLENGSPKYITRTYKLSDLATYFGGFVNDIDLNELINNVSTISTTVTNNTTAISTANQSLTTITNELLAQSTFQTNLSSTFGTFDDDGNLTSLSQAFADQVLQTTASDRYANAQFVTNLAASVGTYDQDGNLITFSNAFAEQILSTTASDIEAVAQFSTNLASSFGTYDEDGNLLTLSSGFVDQVISSTSNEIESISEFATNLAANFGTYNPDGTISEFSNAFADQVFTATASDRFAEATYVNNLGASIGQLNPDGTLVFDINSSYSQGIKTYIENNSAIAESIETLEAIYTNIPVTIRQPDEPPTLDVFNDLAYPLGSIWVDTDDSNALYVLIEDAGSPTGYSWSPTTSEALGDLILSNSQLQQEVNILSTNVSTEATKLDTLRSKFGYFDINTGEFIVENTAEIIADLRTYADSESAAATKAETVRAQVNDGENSIVAQVSETSTAVSNLNGNISASYGIEVDANGNVASMKLLADGTSGTEIRFRSDTFKIFNGNTSTAAFVLDGSQLKLNVPLNGVSGTFTGTMQAGDVTISNSTIDIVAPGRIIFEDESNVERGSIIVGGNSLILDGNTTAALRGGGNSNSVIADSSTGVSITSSADLNAVVSNTALIQGNVVQLTAGSSSLTLTSSALLYNGQALTAIDAYTKTESDARYARLTGAAFTGAVSSTSTFTGTDFVLSSDRILKENIKEYTPKPINIQYKTYNIIGDEEKRFGVIAQELEVDHPEFVRENENGIKSVSYIDVLIAKVAELEARIKELEHGDTK
jgi:hypothetical protein